MFSTVRGKNQPFPATIISHLIFLFFPPIRPLLTKRYSSKFPHPSLISFFPTVICFVSKKGKKKCGERMLQGWRHLFRSNRSYEREREKVEVKRKFVQIFAMEFVSSLCESMRYWWKVLNTYTNLTPHAFRSEVSRKRLSTYIHRER